jgi:hypothetical protein
VQFACCQQLCSPQQVFSSSRAVLLHAASAAAMHLAKHCHGKSRVRVARVWRDAGGQQHVVEFVVNVLLESAMAQAYLAGDNSGMTATDTVKNTARGARLARKSPDPSCHSRKAAHARPACAGVPRGQAAEAALQCGRVRRGARGALRGHVPLGA